MIPSAERSQRLRNALLLGGIVVPGAFNALVARAVERQGFSAVYLSGAAVSNCVVGVPDAGIITLEDVCGHAERIANATALPLIADIDTGFGGPAEAAETVRRIIAAGVSAVHMEDQRVPKRCGHLPGKELIEEEEMVEKIRAASAARTDPNFLLLARTDARAVEGYDAAVRRARLYIEAGADGIFPEALETEDEFRSFARDVPTILLANMTEFGKGPSLPADDLFTMGYRIVIFPMSLVRTAMFAVEETLQAIVKDGATGSMLDRMQTRAQLYELLNYDPNSPEGVDHDSGSGKNRT